MQVRPQNLARWIDELSAIIEDLEKRVDQLTVKPVPVPTDEFKFGYDRLFDIQILDPTTEQVFTDENMSKIADYDMLYIYAQGGNNPPFLFYPMRNNANSFSIYFCDYYAVSQELDAAYQSQFYLQTTVVEGQYQLTVRPETTMTGPRQLSFYGVKIERVVEERTGFIQSVVNKVKSITKGGK